MASIRQDWIDMLPDDRWAFFLHPDWCRVAWECFAPRGSVDIHVAHDDDRLVGLLATCRRRMNRFGLFLPVTEAFVGARGDYSAPVLARGAPSGVLAALLDSCVMASRSSGSFVLANIPADTHVVAGIRQHLEDKGRRFSVVEHSCLRLDLPSPPDDTDVLSSRLLRDIRRQSRRLEEEHGALSFQVCDSSEDALDLLPALFEMHDRRWVGAGHPGSFGDPATRLYYRRLITDLWQYGVHFSVTRCGHTPIAFHLGMISGGYLLYYKPTFRTELARFSPGKIHLHFLMQHAVARGLCGIDFLQGDESYKAQWANAVTPTHTLVVRSSYRTPTFFWLTKGRPRVEQALGGLYRRVSSRADRRRTSDGA